jgi:hypothetical protein
MQTSENPTPPASRRWVVILLMSLPVWLVLSCGLAMWLYFRHEKTQAREEQSRFVTRINGRNVADDVSKLAKVVGERNPGSADAAKGLERAVAFIEGSLGQSNPGHPLKRDPGPQSEAGAWPILTARLAGKDPHLPAIWVVAAYDSRRGSPGVEFNATGVASLIAVAGAISGESFPRDVVFAFVPHGADPKSPVAETTGLLGKLMREGSGAATVLCVDAMGTGGELWVSSRDAQCRAYRKLEGIGHVVGAEVLCFHDDFDVASVLFESGFSAARVGTREPAVPDEGDDVLPAPATLAASSGHLAELVRRLAAKDG